MTAEELAMMDELANDPEFKAYLESIWEETIENIEADTKEGVA